MTRLFYRMGALLCVLLLIGVLAGCEGEPQGDKDLFPNLADTYTESDFENIRFRCTVSWETADGETFEQELPKADSIEIYNLLNRAEWESPESDPVPATRPILCLEFATGDTTKAKNCYGCVYLSDTDDLVFTQSAAAGGMTPLVAPAGTYDAVWEKVSALTGQS